MDNLICELGNFLGEVLGQGLKLVDAWVGCWWRRIAGTASCQEENSQEQKGNPGWGGVFHVEEMRAHLLSWRQCTDSQAGGQSTIVMGAASLQVWR